MSETLKHKRVLLFCGASMAFAISDAPSHDALLSDWMASEGLKLTDTSGFGVLPEATPEYLAELRKARAVKCGKRDADALTRSRLTMLYDNAVKYFPQDLDGL